MSLLILGTALILFIGTVSLHTIAHMRACERWVLSQLPVGKWISAKTTHDWVSIRNKAKYDDILVALHSLERKGLAYSMVEEDDSIKWTRAS